MLSGFFEKDFSSSRESEGLIRRELFAVEFGFPGGFWTGVRIGVILNCFLNGTKVKFPHALCVSGAFRSFVGALRVGIFGGDL